MRLCTLAAITTTVLATAFAGAVEAACPNPEETETRSGSQSLPGAVQLEGSASEDRSCLSLAVSMQERVRFELDHEEAEDGPTNRHALRVDLIQGSGVDWDMDVIYESLTADGSVFTFEQRLGLENIRLSGAWSSRREEESTERSWWTSAEADLIERPDFDLLAETEHQAKDVTGAPEHTMSAGLRSRLHWAEVSLNQARTRHDGQTVETVNSAETSFRLTGLVPHLERLSLAASRLTAEDATEDIYRLGLQIDEDRDIAFAYLAEDDDPGWELSGSWPIPTSLDLPLRLDAATSWRAAGPVARLELRSEFNF